MNQRLFQDIQEFERIDALFRDGVDPDSVDDVKTANALVVMRALADEAEGASMPRAVEFRKVVTRRVRASRRPQWGAIGMAVAAVLIAGFLFFERPAPLSSAPIMIDEAMLDTAFKRETRAAMVDYLDDAKRLLVAMRDFEMACTENTKDILAEKTLARELLLQQKMFTPYINRPEYFQARQLFSDLERILVDVNNLDRCTDTMDVELINDHINQNRIIGKIRLIAKEIEFA